MCVCVWSWYILYNYLQSYCFHAWDAVFHLGWPSKTAKQTTTSTVDTCLKRTRFSISDHLEQHCTWISGLTTVATWICILYQSVIQNAIDNIDIMTSLASQIHFRKKRKGQVNCVYKLCALPHCTVQSNHVAVFCHMTHYISVCVAIAVLNMAKES